MIMVDDIVQWLTNIRCFKAGSCHLSTDGPIEELHTFAASIGLCREWFQEHRIMPHYDLTVSKREAAIKAGAVYVSGRLQARIRRQMKSAAEALGIQTDPGMEWIPTPHRIINGKDQS